MDPEELRNIGLNVECEVVLPVVYGNVKIDNGFLIQRFGLSND